MVKILCSVRQEGKSKSEDKNSAGNIREREEEVEQKKVRKRREIYGKRMLKDLTGKMDAREGKKLVTGKN